MKTTATLLFSAFLAATGAGLAQAATSDQVIDAQAPTTTNQRDLHNVQADYAALQGRGQTVAAAPVAEMAPELAAPQVVDAQAPTTTNQADLHSVNADYQAAQASRQVRADRIASKFAQN